MLRKYTCKICGSEDCEIVLELTDTPLEDQFLKIPITQSTYPLDAALCENCGYLFLTYKVSPTESYHDYLYNSSVTVGLNNHYDGYAEDLIVKYRIPIDSLIVDLGSNDGSMLSSFKKLGMKIIGVEPAFNIAEFANKSNLPTICSFFDSKVTEKIINEHGFAKVVTANYMFANIEDLKAFCQSVETILDDNGIFVIQTGYHLRQFEMLMFDYIYHEHFSYFSVKSLIKLLAQNGLQIIDVEEVTPKGGSIRVVTQKEKGSRTISNNVKRLLKKEQNAKIYSKDFYSTLKIRIEQARYVLRDYLQGLRNRKIKIIGFGASHSTTTLLYHFGLVEFIDSIIDDNPSKQNTFSPGLHIPVFNTNVIKDERSTFAILILAWQHADFIIQRHNHIFQKSYEIIIPLPNLIIKKNYA